MRGLKEPRTEVQDALRLVLGTLSWWRVPDGDMMDELIEWIRRAVKERKA